MGGRMGNVRVKGDEGLGGTGCSISGGGRARSGQSDRRKRRKDCRERLIEEEKAVRVTVPSADEAVAELTLTSIGLTTLFSMMATTLDVNEGSGRISFERYWSRRKDVRGAPLRAEHRALRRMGTVEGGGGLQANGAPRSPRRMKGRATLYRFSEQQ